jgi:2-hydroxymethylglutarate dehydrogenase
MKAGGDMDIGFIGIGQMGKRMAGHLMDAGYDLTVHDIDKSAASGLLERGARWADKPAEVARACRVVITSLPEPGDVEQVVMGPGGLREGWKSGDVYVDMSTNSPSLVRRIAEDAAKMGVTVLDAPVSGGVKGAENGTLAIMAGGPQEAIDRLRDIFMAMGKRIFPVGEVGCGNVAKLVNNLVSLACNSISAEGFVLGTRAGIKPDVLWEIIGVSTGNNWCMQQYPETTFRGNFKPGFRIGLAYKDIGLALDMGREYGVPLPVGEVVRDDLRAAVETGLADSGVDAVILPLEKAAGVEVRTSDAEK